MHQHSNPDHEDLARQEFPQIEEAVQKLESHLGVSDRELVHQFRKDQGRMVNWGKIEGEILPSIIAFVEDLCFPGEGLCDEKLYKAGTFPLSDEIYDAEDLIFNSSELRGQSRRHLLILETVKKVLGIFKSSINQRIRDIPQFSEEEEISYQAIVDEAKAEGHWIEVGSEGYSYDGPDSLLPTSPKVVARFDVEVQPPEDLSIPGKCGEDNHHTRTVVKRAAHDDGYEKITQCKDCGQVLSRQDFLHRPQGQGKDETVQPCVHPGALWDQGKEGVSSHCSICKAPVDPQGYLWDKAGLEEYQDDPSQDEVVTLKTY